MSTVVIRTAKVEDYPRIVELNEASVVETSPMDYDRLVTLNALAQIHWVAEVDGCVEAFLLAMQKGSTYESVNFEWFDGRYDNFLYIDRIVVAEGCRQRGVASQMYQKLFLEAARLGVDFICAEINVEPPNQISMDFHRKYRFEEVGSQSVQEGTKRVSLQRARVK